MSECQTCATCEACEQVRHDLCRLAVGGEASAPAEHLARHARACAACRAFADDVAGVSRWLDGRALGPGRGAAAAERLAERASRALERELGARLARDLLELGQGRPDREARLRRLDLLRLAVLRGSAVLRRPPWRGTLRLLSRRRLAIDRRRALGLAWQLDPMGLDVALAYLAQLEKDGQRSAADAEADRMLGVLV